MYDEPGDPESNAHVSSEDGGEAPVRWNDARPHPIRDWLAQNGPGLHHFCLKVDNVGQAFEQVGELGLKPAPVLHQGTQGKRALFINPCTTDGVRVEVTGA